MYVRVDHWVEVVVEREMTRRVLGRKIKRDSSFFFIDIAFQGVLQV